MAVPAALYTVARSCVAAPMAASVSAPGLTEIRAAVVAGSAETATAAVPVFPSTVAVIVALPTATPVTIPEADTVATAALEVLHATARPGTR
jgi:hypothetical protein